MFTSVLSRAGRSNGSAVLFARIASLIAAAVQLPLLTRTLQPHEFTIVTAAIASSAYFNLFSLEATTLAFQRHAGSRTSPESYEAAGRRIFLAGGAASAGVLLIGALVGHLYVAFAIVGWGLGLGMMRFIATAWLMWGKPWRYSASLVVSTSVRTLALVLGVILGCRAELAVGIAGLFSAAIAMAFAPKISFRRPPRTAPWPRWFGFSLAAASLGVTLMQGTDRLLVPVLVGASDAASYAAMSTLCALSLGALQSTINTAHYPQLIRVWSEKDVEATLRHYSISAAAVVRCGVAAILGVALVGGPLVTLVVGSRFTDLKILVGLLGATALFGLGQQASWQFHLTLESTKLRNRSLISAVITLISMMGFGAAAGVQGVVCGLILGSLIYAISLMMYPSWRVSGLLPPTVLLIATLGAMELTGGYRIAWAGLACLVSLWAERFLAPSSGDIETAAATSAKV